MARDAGSGDDRPGADASGTGIEPIEHRVVVAGREYRVHETGTGTGSAATVLLVHGIGMTHASLLPVQRALPRGTRCLNVDLAGFGPTGRPRTATTIEDYATDLASLLDRFDAVPVVAAGHSMGTQVVLELARLCPADVRAIVLVGPVVDPDRHSIRRQSADLVRDTFGEPMPVNALVARDYIRGGVRWYVKVLREMMRYPTLERMRGCRVPAVVVRGERDPIARAAWCRALVDANGAPARLVVVPGDHHVVPRTSPDRLASEIAALARDPDADVSGS